MAAVHAANANRNPDDGRPWFVARYLMPPEWREVLLLWSDGNISTGVWRGDVWANDYWSSHRQTRDDPPAAWKPMAMLSGNSGRVPLPDPLRFGVKVV